MKMVRLFTAGVIALITPLVWAWQVEVQPDKSEAMQVLVSAESSGEKRHTVYLVWYDVDAEPEKAFLSWRLDGRWHKSFQPISDKPIQVDRLDKVPVAKLPQSCPADHACLLALVALADFDKSALQSQNWEKVSILPLSPAAAQMRFPGQRTFVVPDASSRNFEEAVPPAAPDAAATVTADADKNSGAETEKPDIFRLVGDKILYANSSAERFQVIDIANPEQPVLVDSVSLTGHPSELYVLGEWYVLLQNDYAHINGTTHLTVIGQNAQGKLAVLSEETLEGRFMQSRRREDVIYTLSQRYDTFLIDEPVETTCVDCDGTPTVGLIITAWQFAEGKLRQVQQETMTGYGAVTAIFPDYLVLANHNPQHWQTMQVQLFDLRNPQTPLQPLPMIELSGYIPSEFHLDVTGEQFRVVYGPENREAGSTLAIYDLTQSKPTLLGQVSDIAPGERLHATRFVKEKAYVVTFENTDPLWVIDLSDPQAPRIEGELIVPGWSEKLFFHEDRLFAVGIENEPLEDEMIGRVRRVAMSLFDVSNPTQPTLLDKFVPFAGEGIRYNYSPAIYDERALLLHWPTYFAALPINSWETQIASHLQLVTFDQDKFKNEGRLGSPVNLQRSVAIAPEQLAALGDQSLYTLAWGDGKVKQLGELELAVNLGWLDQIQGSLWAGGYGGQYGLHRLYRYDPAQLEDPIEKWPLSDSYMTALTNDNQIVFYTNYYRNDEPFRVQILDVTSGELHPVQKLTIADVKPDVELLYVDAYAEMSTISAWRGERGDPLMRDSVFYLPEQHGISILEPLPVNPNESNEVEPKPLPVDSATARRAPPASEDWEPKEPAYRRIHFSEWKLRAWDLAEAEPTEMPIRSIPGKPVGFLSNGKLVTKETTAQGYTRLNLVNLYPGSTELLQTRVLPCVGSYYSQHDIQLLDDTIYLSCKGEPVYYAWPEDDQKAKEPPVETSRLLKLNPEQGFAEEGEWMMEGRLTLIDMTDQGTALLQASGGYYYPMPMIDVVDVAAIAPTKPGIMPYSSGCFILRLGDNGTTEQVAELDSCPTSNFVMTDTQGWQARGFAGIKQVTW